MAERANERLLLKSGPFMVLVMTMLMVTMMMKMSMTMMVMIPLLKYGLRIRVRSFLMMRMSEATCMRRRM